jgi:hypothetical protein
VIESRTNAWSNPVTLRSCFGLSVRSSAHDPACSFKFILLPYL